jgi:hypothetical protein
MLYCQLLDNDIKCMAQTAPLPVFLSLLFEYRNIGFALHSEVLIPGSIYHITVTRTARCHISGMTQVHVPPFHFCVLTFPGNVLISVVLFFITELRFSPPNYGSCNYLSFRADTTVPSEAAIPKDLLVSLA